MQAHPLTHARLFAKAMDSQFRFFGIRFGVENILGLVPGVGDTLTLLLSFYLVAVAIEHKLPPRKILGMLLNITIDSAIGFLPIIGDISDVFFQANMRNLHILERHFETTLRS